MTRVEGSVVSFCYAAATAANCGFFGLSTAYVTLCGRNENRRIPIDQFKSHKRNSMASDLKEQSLLGIRKGQPDWQVDE